MMSPMERYQFLLSHRPMYLQRIPLRQLASYLGMSRETLTRIRKKMNDGIEISYFFYRQLTIANSFHEIIIILFCLVGIGSSKFADRLCKHFSFANITTDKRTLCRFAMSMS